MYVYVGVSISVGWGANISRVLVFIYEHRCVCVWIVRSKSSLKIQTTGDKIERKGIFDEKS